MIFSRRTVKPLASKIANALNKFLFLDKWTFEFVNIVPTDLQETRLDWNDWGITLNEFRKTRWLPSIKWGDAFKTVLWLWEPIEFEEKKSVPKLNNNIIGKQIWNAIIKSFKSQIKWTEEYRDAWRSMKDQRIVSFEKEYKKKLQTIFVIQEKDIIKDFKNWYSAGKSIKASMPLLNTIKYSIIYYQLLKGIQNDLVETEVAKALIEVNIWEPANIFTPEIQKNLEKNIKKFSFAIDQITNEKLQNQYQSIINEWLSVEQWVDRLKSTVFAELKTSRVERIVRTETIRAWNIGTQLWYEQSGVVEKKQWYTAQDERVCPFCWPEHWKVIGLTDDFFGKWETLVRIWDSGKPVTMNTDYWEIWYPPLHPNCRCTILPIIE